MPITRFLAALALGITVSTTGFLNPRVAGATETQPGNFWSYYMNTTSSPYNLGCNQGHAGSALVFLDFGNQLLNGSGTEEVFDNFTYTNAQIENIAEDFLGGFVACGGQPYGHHLDLVIGTRDSHDVVGNGTTHANGVVWAEVVAAVQAYIERPPSFANWVLAWGGSDFEPSWNSFSNVDAWITGFGNSALYLNYGSADGCPETPQTIGNLCANNWSEYDMWWTSWGPSNAYTAPEIYTVNGSQAAAWTMVSYYGDVYRGSRVVYDGPLDEHDLASSTNTGSAAWTQFWNSLNSYPQTAQNMPFSLEVHDE